MNYVIDSFESVFKVHYEEHIIRVVTEDNRFSGNFEFWPKTASFMDERLGLLRTILEQINTIFLEHGRDIGQPLPDILRLKRSELRDFVYKSAEDNFDAHTINALHHYKRIAERKTNKKDGNP